jgi:Flp pilus assembly pilin Flp
MNAIRTSRQRLPRPSGLSQLTDESGAVAIEYGLIAALIVLAILGTIIQLRDSLVGLPLQLLIDAFNAALS